MSVASFNAVTASVSFHAGYTLAVVLLIIAVVVIVSLFRAPRDQTSKVIHAWAAVVRAWRRRGE